MNSEYVRIAHRRTVLAELQRIIKERFLPGPSGTPKTTLICEEVFYNDREVTTEALCDVLEQLQELEYDSRVLMSQFEFRRKNVRPVPDAASRPVPEPVDPSAEDSGPGE